MLVKFLKIMKSAVPWNCSTLDWWGLMVRVVWFPSQQEIVRNKSFTSDSIPSKIFLTWLLWEGIYICKIKILSEMKKRYETILSVRLNLVRKRLKWFIREGYSFWNDSGRRRLHLKLFLREGVCQKIKWYLSQFEVCPSSVLNNDWRKIQNWKITPVIVPFSIIMYRSYNVFFYS